MLGGRAGLKKIEFDQVLGDAGGIFADDVKKRVDHLRLKLRRDAADHSEIKERESCRRPSRADCRDADRRGKNRLPEAA